MRITPSNSSGRDPGVGHGEPVEAAGGPASRVRRLLTVGRGRWLARGGSALAAREDLFLTMFGRAKRESRDSELMEALLARTRVRRPGQLHRPAEPSLACRLVRDWHCGSVQGDFASKWGAIVKAAAAGLRWLDFPA